MTKVLFTFAFNNPLKFTQLKLCNYISDLLYRYDCVIVPGFGGFVTSTKSAVISPYSKTFYPPHKVITFNSHLKNNDGLLANYIATLDQVPYEHAINFIKFEVGQWFDLIKQSDLTLTSIGKFTLGSSNNIIFEPQTEVNYLTEAFGLTPFILPEVKREVLIKETTPIVERPVPLATKDKKESYTFLKYAAVFMIGLSLLGVAGNSIYQKHTTEQQNIVEQEQQQQIQTKIEKATFIVSEALPTLGVEVTLDKKPYHIIAGAFRYPENAQRLVNQLTTNGYKARILGVNKWGLTQVSYESYTEKNDAINGLYRIRETESDNGAWLLIQDL